MKRESIGVYWFWSTFSVNYFCELTKKKGIFKSSTNLWNGIHSQIILNHKLWSKVYIYQNRMLCSRAPLYDSMHFSELAYEYLKIRLLQSISSNSLQKWGISVYFLVEFACIWKKFHSKLSKGWDSSSKFIYYVERRDWIAKQKFLLILPTRFNTSNFTSIQLNNIVYDP